MLNYLKEYGNMSWDERPITDVDLAEFSQLIYNPFEKLGNKCNEGLTLRELYPLVYRDGYPTATWSWPQNILKQWELISDCSRFLDVRLDNFHAIFNPKIDEQFAAGTFRVGDIAIVVFRGTDESIVGWKEDLNMGYRVPLPCHYEAVKYLENELNKYDKIYVVGQSKGGHLAVYSSANLIDNSRIVKVLSLEGPGLDKETYRKHWRNIKNKVEVLIPNTAIIGMSLGYGGNFSVINSTAKAIMQHDPFSWTVENGIFKTRNLSHFSVYFYRVMHDFVEGTSDEEREVLVKTIFKMIDSLDVDEITELKKAIFTNFIMPIMNRDIQYVGIGYNQHYWCVDFSKGVYSKQRFHYNYGYGYEYGNGIIAGYGYEDGYRPYIFAEDLGLVGI